MNILEISHVKKHFGDKQVLTDLSFSVPEHTLFGFVGQNGSGKTTTMNIILGLLAADSGEVRVCSEKVHYGQTDTNKFIGYLPDVPEFYSYMKPWEYLKFCGEISGMDNEKTASRSSELLELVGLKNETHRIKGFSRGMKQRLGIAQALMCEPKLLICDEPTSALDPLGRKEILDILVAAKERTTVVFSTHILSDVERICDETAFLHNGEIVLQGTLDQVKQHQTGGGFELELENFRDTERIIAVFPTASRLSGTHISFDSQFSTEDIMKILISEHISPVRLEKCEPTLESLFLEVVGK